MKNILRPILLSQNKEGWDIGDILKCINPIPGGHNVGYLMIADSRFDGYTSAHPYYDVQHLYMIDDIAPIKEGDWAYSHNYNTIWKVTADSLKVKQPTLKDSAVLASTNSKLIADGVLSISEEFLKQFVDAQGNGEVVIERKLVKRNTANMSITFSGFKLDNSGNAVLSIVPNLSYFKEKFPEITDMDMFYDDNILTGNYSIEEAEKHMQSTCDRIRKFKVKYSKDAAEKHAIEKGYEGYHIDTSEESFKAGWEECKKHYNIKD